MAAAVANNPVEVEPENSSWCPRVAAMASKKAESDLKFTTQSPSRGSSPLRAIVYVKS